MFAFQLVLHFFFHSVLRTIVGQSGSPLHSFHSFLLPKRICVADSSHFACENIFGSNRFNWILIFSLCISHLYNLHIAYLCITAVTDSSLGEIFHQRKKIEMNLGKYDTKRKPENQLE